MNCPKCAETISAENINVQTDIGQCNSCTEVFRISEQVMQKHNDGFDLTKPPQGAWINHTPHQLILGATTRSPMAFFLVPFMLVWSGMSIGGIYGTQIMSGNFDLVLSLFGIPFLLGSVIFWGLTLLLIFGKLEITLSRAGGIIFMGIGKIGKKDTFSWSEVSTIVEKEQVSRKKNYTVLELRGAKRIVFGRFLKSERQYYIFRSMEVFLNKKAKGEAFL